MNARNVIAAVSVTMLALPGAARAEDDALRDKAMSAWKDIRNYRLKKALGLDDAAAAKLAEALDRDDAEHKTVHERMRRGVRELRAALDAGEDDAALTRRIDALVAARERIAGLQVERVRRVRKVLSPREQARLVMMLPRLERHMRRMIEDARGEGEGEAGWDDGPTDGPPHGPPPRRGPPSRRGPRGPRP